MWEYSYNDGDLYYFMNMETFDMVPLNKDALGESFKFITENTPCKLLSHKGNVFSVEVPNFMDLEVTQTEPGLAGNTATNTLKPATLETGAEIKVPLFINIGDKIQIDTPHRRVSGPCKIIHSSPFACSVATHAARIVSSFITDFALRRSKTRKGVYYYDNL